MSPIRKVRGLFPSSLILALSGPVGAEAQLPKTSRIPEPESETLRMASDNLRISSLHPQNVVFAGRRKR
jgi:hypothetical protein